MFSGAIKIKTKFLPELDFSSFGSCLGDNGIGASILADRHHRAEKVNIDNINVENIISCWAEEQSYDQKKNIVIELSFDL